MAPTVPVRSTSPSLLLVPLLLLAISACHASLAKEDAEAARKVGQSADSRDAREAGEGREKVTEPLRLERCGELFDDALWRRTQLSRGLLAVPDRVLLVTLPDPVETPGSETFDSALNALITSITSLGFVRDRYILPWDRRSPDTAHAMALRCPGLMLFRDPTGKSLDGVAVFVIGESWLSGIDKLAWQAALFEVARSAPVAPPQGRALRILAPYYSASAQSLALLLADIGQDFRAASGTMSSPYAREMLGPSHRVFSPSLPERVCTLQPFLKDFALLKTSGTVYSLFYRDLESPRLACRNSRPVAFDSEKCRLTADPDNCPVRPKLSLEAQWSARDSGGSEQVWLRADAATPGGAPVPVDVIVPTNLRFTSATNDLAVHDGALALDASNIANVIVADELTQTQTLLAMRLKRETPDLRLVFLRWDRYLEMPQFTSDLHGSLVVAAYPPSARVAGPTQRSVNRLMQQLPSAEPDSPAQQPAANLRLCREYARGAAAQPPTMSMALSRDQVWGSYYAARWLLCGLETEPVAQHLAVGVISRGQYWPLSVPLTERGELALADFPPIQPSLLFLLVTLCICCLAPFSGPGVANGGEVAAAQELAASQLQSSRAAVVLAWLAMSIQLLVGSLAFFSPAAQDSGQIEGKLGRGLVFLVASSLLVSTWKSLAQTRWKESLAALQRNLMLTLFIAFCVVVAGIVVRMEPAESAALAIRAAALTSGASPLAALLVCSLFVWMFAKFAQHAALPRPEDESAQDQTFAWVVHGKKGARFDEIVSRVAAVRERVRTPPSMSLYLLRSAGGPRAPGPWLAIGSAVVVMLASVPAILRRGFTLEHTWIGIALAFGLAICCTYVGITVLWVAELLQRLVRLLHSVSCSDLLEAFVDVPSPLTRSVTEQVLSRGDPAEKDVVLRLLQDAGCAPCGTALAMPAALRCLAENARSGASVTESQAASVRRVLATHIATTISPWIRQLVWLMSLAALGSVLLLVASWSYVFSVQHLLLSFFSLLTGVVVCLALIVFTVLERNPVLSRIARVPPATFLLERHVPRLLGWIVVPVFMAFASYYPNVVSAALQWFTTQGVIR